MKIALIVLILVLGIWFAFSTLMLFIILGKLAALHEAHKQQNQALNYMLDQLFMREHDEQSEAGRENRGREKGR